MKGAPLGNKNAAGPHNGNHPGFHGTTHKKFSFKDAFTDKRPGGGAASVAWGALGIPGAAVAGYRSRKKYGPEGDARTAEAASILPMVSSMNYGHSLGANVPTMAALGAGTYAAAYGASRLGSYVAGKTGNKRRKK